jgi:hypothetical protein
MNSQMLIPNPFMPAEVRMAHFLETASSNFLFGWLLVWVLFSCRKSTRHVSEGNAQMGSDDRKRFVPV